MHPEPPNSDPRARTSRDGQASSAARRFTNLERYGTVDSTSRIARDALLAGAPDGLVVVADEQLAGRGRRDRRWVAPRGSSLLCSIALRPAVARHDFHLITSAVALAARAATNRYGSKLCDLKWPNDLVAGEKKLAGLLAEVVEGTGNPADRAPALVVGIGCNLAWPADWPGSTGDPELAELVAGAVTVEQLHGVRVERDEFLEAMLGELEPRYASIASRDGADRLRAEYREACATIGSAVRVELVDETFDARATGIADDGRLALEVAGGRRLIAVGDLIHLRRDQSEL